MAADRRRPSEELPTAQVVVEPSAASADVSFPTDPAIARLVVPANSEVIPDRIGDYRVLSVLGQGGMGTVYLAEDVRLGRKAAVKTMRPDAAASATNRERFLREARAAAQLDHDYIVPIWQVGEAADGTFYIAMPALRGETLGARLKREPIPPLAVTLKVAREVAEGLAAAHARGLVHRDVKPLNIWLEGDPNAAESAERFRRCRILDFGLVRSTHAGDPRLTVGGSFNGTPPYIAPEQIRGKEVDHRADLFALGVILYRMAAGDVPFTGETLLAVVYAVTTLEPPPAAQRNPALPFEVSALIGRLLSKDPAGRPKSAADVAREVRRIEESLARPAPPAVTAPLPKLPSPATPAAGTARPGPKSMPRREPPKASPAPPAEEDEDSYPWERFAAAREPEPEKLEPEPVGGGLIVGVGLMGLALVVAAAVYAALR